MSAESREWFEVAFRELYPIVYAHRDDDQAQQEVGFLLGLIGSDGLNPILDVGCGTGRHLRAFRSAGLSDSVGLDLAPELLAQARESGFRLTRGDMRRIPFKDAGFGLVTSFFTSFGFFATDDDDRRVLQEMCRVLRPSGSFFMDFLDADAVRRSLVPTSSREISGWRIDELRRIENDRVKKQVTAKNLGSAKCVRYEESVRLYSHAEVTDLLQSVGLNVISAFGGYDREPVGSGTRLLILAQKR